MSGNDLLADRSGAVAFLTLPVSAMAGVHWLDLATVFIPLGWAVLFGAGLALVI